MKKHIITTADGSSTVYIPEWNEHYHSKHGAIQEAYHVFINKGLVYFCKTHPETNPITILEIGFGTGLNALITLKETQHLHKQIDYYGVEAYPIKPDEINKLNYAEQLRLDTKLFRKLHEVPWACKALIAPHFSLQKKKQFFSEITTVDTYNIIYFDAFGARVQPELWTETIFNIMYKALKKGGVLVTYSAKGSVRRAMQMVGFDVEKLPGPPGKREMLRATKNK